MELKTDLKPKVTIDITPLVDIVFLLLIFFMVTSTFLELPGMKLDLPEAASSSGEEAAQLTVYLTRRGDILLEGGAVSLDGLVERLRAEQSLVIKGDKDVSYGRVVEVMDKAKAAGVRKLVIATVFPAADE